MDPRRSPQPRHHTPPLPPPPPSPPATSSSDVRRRGPGQLPSITTALTAAQRFQTHLRPTAPASAHPTNTTFSPLSTSPVPSSASAAPSMASGRGSSSATSPYNPQEWSRNTPVSGSYMPHGSARNSRRAVAPRDMTGMESTLPSPPPPYSESPQSSTNSARSTRPSPNLASFSSFTTSPTSYSVESNTPISATNSASSGRISPSYSRSELVRPQPVSGQQYSPSSFPPPPLSIPRDRSTSRSRFNLSAFTSRSRINNASPSSSAMETLQRQTNDALIRSSESSQLQSSPVVPPTSPPAARRAASTGCIGPSTAQERRPLQQLTPNHGEGLASQGFPIPPPPPGPPPGLRSQSLNRIAERAQDLGISNNATSVASNRSRSTRNGTQLGPIPPTPAGWIDEDTRLHSRQARSNNSESSTRGSEGSVNYPSPESERNAAQGSSGAESTWPEVAAVRGIRERRSESRASRVRSKSRDLQGDADRETFSNVEDHDEAKPANLVLNQATGALSRRRHVNKAKTSPLFKESPSPQSQRRHLASDGSQMSDSSFDLFSPQRGSEKASTPGTPFSSGNIREVQQFQTQDPARQSVSSASPAQPIRREESSAKIPVAVGKHQDREARNSSQGGENERLLNTGPTNNQNKPRRGERAAFERDSSERHTRFIEQESASSNDAERLELFAQFIVTESRLRRDLYAEAFDSLGPEVLELTRDLWKSYNEPKRSRAATPVGDPVKPQTPNSGTGPAFGASAGSRDSDELQATGQKTTEPVGLSPTPKRTRGDSQQRQGSFEPCLSPIPSMAMSTAPDDGDSRGRAPSRWWESSSGPGSVGEARRLERSKRESKYMGLPREARESLQWEQSRSGQGYDSQNAVPGDYYNLGPNQYPSEKSNWQDEVNQTPSPGPARNPQKSYNPRKLDVSRLVTLPPPYPRHHPAVNNNHPDLSDSRATLRSLNDESQIEEVRREYETDPDMANLRPESPASAAGRRQTFRRSIQQRVNQGITSFAEAAQEEADFDVQEQKRSRRQASQAFDEFKARVMTPLNTLYAQKILQATNALDELGESLNSEARSHNPNQTQEEGDEQPELLEKLTLMKWLNEARDHLHKVQFELESESDSRYKELILSPYRQMGNHGKVREVESFFSQDIKKRRSDYELKAQERMEAFHKTVEDHVTRGVEVQLSAFWDIAPSLHAIIQQVPQHLEGFEIVIPDEEYQESPSYHEYPMQYLYTLLDHTGKSAYQFIESQTNLLCLLHEVKTGIMTAECRVQQTQRELAGEDVRLVQDEIQQTRKVGDRNLTGDLKERVGLVEEQWRQALGKGLEDLQDRIKTFLFETGGWDENMED